MFGKFNDAVERALQADGYIPAGFDTLWIGDEFVWEGSFTEGNPLRYLRIVSLHAQDASYTDEGGIPHQNTIVKIIATDQDGIFRHMQVSTGHTTWVRQCGKNRRELFDLHAEYAEVASQDFS